MFVCDEYNLDDVHKLHLSRNLTWYERSPQSQYKAIKSSGTSNGANRGFHKMITQLIKRRTATEVGIRWSLCKIMSWLRVWKLNVVKTYRIRPTTELHVNYHHKTEPKRSKDTAAQSFHKMIRRLNGALRVWHVSRSRLDTHNCLLNVDDELITSITFYHKSVEYCHTTRAFTFWLDRRHRKRFDESS